MANSAQTVSPFDFHPDEDAVIHMSGVTVQRRQTTLLSHIDWKVKEDERWIVMGPNGAGKSTLVNIAAARLFPSSGNVSILDEVMGTVDVFELRPRIGVSSVLLANQVPAHEKVLDLVLTAGYGVTGRWVEEYEPEDLERAQWLLNRWGISGYAERKFGTLSEGERKRALIARAMMTDPELLLLDEPASGLDLTGREALVRTLSQLAQDEFAPTQVLVTHHVEDIPQNFTHALLLRDGQQVAAGPLEATLTEENLSEAFRLPLKLLRTDDGRYSAFART